MIRGDELLAVRDLGYVPADGASQPAQKHLRQMRARLASSPMMLGYKVRVSGASQNLPHVPWVAVLDPDVTSTARRGLYVVYLYSADLKHLYLTMNQGATAHQDAARAHRSPGVSIDSAALAALSSESSAIRTGLPPELRAGTDASIDLANDGFLPRGYEAGTIAAVKYDLANLPADGVLNEQLQKFLQIYDASVTVRRDLTQTDPGRFSTPATKRAAEPPVFFRPKDDADYVASVSAQAQVRSRRHEAVLKDFGLISMSGGWTANTNVHPRDLVLTKPGKSVLCEVKTVGPNAEHAVREVIGQLFSYRHFFPAPSTQQQVLLGVFSEPVGDALVGLLNGLGIAAVWRSLEKWEGCQLADREGLVPTTGSSI